MRISRSLLYMTPLFGPLIAIGLWLFMQILFVAIFASWPVIVVLMAASACVMAIFYWCVYRRIGRLALRIRRFHTISGDRLRIHYDPALENKADWPAMLGQCRSLLGELTLKFESLLRRKVNVFVFESAAEITHIMGDKYGAFALPQCSSIVVGYNYQLPGVVRHELAHLFLHRWNPYAPPLLGEGLPTLLESSPRVVDDFARPFARDPWFPLMKLMRSRFSLPAPIGMRVT